MRKTKKLLSVLIAVVLAFSCFAAIPMTASAATTVTTAADLTAKLADSSVSHIIIGASINGSFTVNRNVTIEGSSSVTGYHLDGTGTTDTMLTISAGTVTLKNLKINSNGDTVSLSGSPNITMSGGEIYNGNTSNSRWGAIYVGSGFTGYLKLIDDAVIQSKNYAIYSTSASNITGSIALYDCQITKLTGGDTSKRGDLINLRSNLTIRIGGGDEGQEAVLTSNVGKLIWSEEKGTGLIEIKNGAVLKQTSGSYGIHVNTGYRLMIMGGQIECKGTAVVMASETGYSKISGGTITSGDNERTIQKNNGAITITGGTIINTNGGAAIKTSSTSSLKGALWVEGGTYNTTATPFVFDGAFSTNFQNTITYEGDAPMVKVASGVTVCLDNAHLTSNDLVILPSDGAIITTKGTSSMTSVNGIVVPAGTALPEGLTVNNGGEAVKIAEVNGVKYEVLADALAAIENGGTLNIIAEVNDVALDADKTYTVVTTGDGVIIGQIIITAGNVTLKDITAKGVKFNNAANVVIDGGNYNGGNEIGTLIADSAATGSVTVKNGANFTCGNKYVVQLYENSNATFNLEDGTFTDTDGDAFSIGGLGTINFGKADGTGSVTVSGLVDIIWWTKAGGATVNVYEGTTVSGENTFNINGSNNPTINIYGGEFNPTGHGMKIQQTSTINVSGGTFTSTGADKAGIYLYNNAPIVNVSGGTFNGMAIRTSDTCTGGEVNVTGGTFNDISTDYMFKFNSSVVKYNFADVVVERTDHEEVMIYLCDGAYVEFENCEIYPGSQVFEGTKAASAKFIDCEFEDPSSEPITIVEEKIVCEIGDSQYYSIEEAMADVQDGDTITLIEDIVGSVEFNADKTYTVNGDGFIFYGTATVSAGNVTFTDINSLGGIVADGAANVVIDGGIIEVPVNALTLGSSFTGTLTVKGNAAITAEGFVIAELAGNTGTLNLEACTLTDTSGELADFRGAGTINIAVEGGEEAVIINANLDTASNMFYLGSTATTTFNIYDGADLTGTKIFRFGSTASPTVNVYGGSLKASKNVQVFDFYKGSTVVNVYGGSFGNANGGTIDSYAWFRSDSISSVLNVYGGTFKGGSIFASDGAIFGTGTGNFEATINVSNINVSANIGSNPLIFHRANSGSLTLNNVTLTHKGSKPAIEATKGNGKVVTINGCNFNAYTTVANFSVEGENTMTVNFEGEKSTLTSSLGEVIAKTEGVIINGLEENAEEVIKYEGDIVRMLRIAGKTRDDYPNVNRDMRIEGNTTYTYSFNYRATAGAVPYITVQYKNAEGTWVDVEATTDTGAYAEYTFTTGEVPAEGNTFRIRLGSKGKAAIASSGTAYFANVTLKAADSDVNLIENGDFAYGPKDWNIGNNNPVACYDFDFIPYVAELFDDEALANNNAALLLKGGNRHEAQFFVGLEAGASYTFKFDYRSNTSFFTVGAYNDAVIEEVSTEGFTKTYTISNPAEKAIKARVYFRLGEDSYDANLYISNLVLFNNADENQVNMIADLNPIFGTADNIRMNQQSDVAVKNIIGHGWLGNFQKDSDGGNVNTGSSKYTSIVEIPEDFFTVYEDAQILVNLKKILVDLVEETINPYEDANNDGVVDIKDLIRVQKKALGLLGSEAAEAELKAVIDAGVETATNGTEYYVETVEDLKNAVSKSGAKTIFLKRGNTYRSTSEIALNSNTTLSAYGEGAKPEIIGSAMDYKTSTWTDNGNNIWSVSLGSSNEVGNIYLFKGNEVISGVGFTGNRSKGTVRFTSDAELANQGDYYQSGRTLRIYSVGNPATVYDRIEIAQSHTLLGLNDNVTVENIAVKYSGGHGMQGSDNLQNVTVRYCEVAYVGGRTNNGEGDPLGNGIEFGNGGSNLEASYNYVYQCYDSAITPQAYTAGYGFDNVRITNNLLTNNFYGMEIWGTSNSLLKDILVEGNIIANTGYCWSFEQRPLDGNIAMFSAHIYGGRNSYNNNANNSIIIRNNTFSNARVNIICWFWGGVDGVEATKYEKLTTEGNIYYQDNVNWDGYIMRYGDVDKFDYATSQQSLQEAVATFDENAILVAWLG